MAKGKNRDKVNTKNTDKMAEKDVPTIASPSEFAKIPLDFVIATPLLTTIEAHMAAAETTLHFIKGLSGQNQTFKMNLRTTDKEGKESSEEREVNVPLLAIAKVPSLNFDSLSVSFKYNISQVITETSGTKSRASAEIGTKGLLSKFLSASLTGSIEHSSNRENTVNRGGTLDVKIHVSESQLPAGLEKIINAMVENIPVPTKNS
ncbi:DUF2589 domain-containing protein [Fulvivirga sp. RKSG066]|uniref:DUF2589 domain-containing protein n=1 Tax=Fulvivirga aurantia TaxID=2529383 RepID=UPI0012BCAB45|nr:DUF2589 domain-containing protein [Fulvivirga aurantia]MTI23162.1 DUF2589 domain-containing protein [Fulvivirga aurantia]